MFVSVCVCVYVYECNQPNANSNAFPYSIHIIRFMPFDGNHWSDKKMVGYEEMLRIISKEFKYKSLENPRNDVSKSYQVPGFVGKFSFISSMTDHFCYSCNRLRLTADGNLKVRKQTREYCFCMCVGERVNEYVYWRYVYIYIVYQCSIGY